MPLRVQPSSSRIAALGLLLAALVALVTVTSATSATRPKPKPWQWKPTKVVARLTAASPIIGGDVGSDILSAQCTTQGRGVAGRFSRFTCVTKWGDSNGNYSSTLTLRVLPLGSGKLCVVTTTNNSSEIVAVPHKPNTAGTRIVPERACP